MVVKFQFAKGNLNLPVNYNHILQAFIYKSLDDYSSFLHDFGFLKGKKRFKFFVFSRLFGQFFRRSGRIEYHAPITFYIGTPYESIGKRLVDGIVSRGLLGKLPISRVQIIEPYLSENTILLKTLSPITAYVKGDNGKRIYLSPEDERFYQLLKKNMEDKYHIVHGEPYVGDMQIQMESFEKRVVGFKSGWITAWDGIVRVRASQDMIKLMLESGLGSKNSQGFGMVLPLNLFER